MIKFWDLYFNERWIGISIGDTAQAAIRHAKCSLPDIRGQLRVIFYKEL